MNANDFVKLLGLTWDDALVQQFLAEYGLAKRKPRIDPNSFAGYLINKKLGLNATFRDEQDVTFRLRDYDEGELVLTNVRVYGEGSTQGYAPFQGEFPHALEPEFGLKEVEVRLGKPAAANPAIALGRWDFKDHCLAVIFDKAHKRICSVAVQLPVAGK